MDKKKKLNQTFFTIFFCFGIALTSGAAAEFSSEDNNVETFDTPRFTLHIDSDSNSYDSSKKLDNKTLAKGALDTLNQTFEQLTKTFELYPTQKVTLRFLTPEEFSEQTGAPSWTNAMYYRGEISIPLSESNLKDIDDLNNAVRHEYVHAFLAEVTRHRCPAWMDEGLAQLIEGKPNSLLGPSLRKWIKNNDAIPLEDLRNGFTTLDRSVVPVAYAQSLFVSRLLVKEHGYAALKNYLLELRKEANPEDAFFKAFNVKQSEFETFLTSKILAWSNTALEHP